MITLTIYIYIWCPVLYLYDITNIIFKYHHPPTEDRKTTKAPMGEVGDSPIQSVSGSH